MLNRLFGYYPETKHDTLVNNLERAERVEEIHFQYYSPKIKIKEDLDEFKQFLVNSTVFETKTVGLL